MAQASQEPAVDWKCRQGAAQKRTKTLPQTLITCVEKRARRCYSAELQAANR